jgi:thymidylate synthase ThyX
MTISAEIVMDSLSTGGARVTTLKLVYPRFVHGEFMTHRVFSRNASSSRAIPISKMIEAVDSEPAEPSEWGRNEPGMQSRRLLEDIDLKAAQAVWRGAARVAARTSAHLAEIGCHKQIANRVTEPWQHMAVVCTATDFNNFFTLRCHPDADPTMQDLGWAMADAYFNSQPRPCADGEWHLPFTTAGERLTLDIKTLLACSVARCARVSYKNHDGSLPIVSKDLELTSSLSSSGHWSPFEHQAQALADASQRSGNFLGWLQHRQSFLTQNVEIFDYQRAVASRRPARLPLPTR